ncbi:MAG: heavy-metal-associated domain-containing protein [Betaproteobacteria bacterium]|nr:heavy-metal-associated domain-containing protein [Betaproteobacteria bacterium]
MTCGGCVRSVSNLLNAVDGVAKAEVSLDKQCAVVDYDAAKLNQDQLKHSIHEVGYEVAG